jgi:hypothetical protein
VTDSYQAGVARGRLDGLEIVTLETVAWIRLAREKSGNEQAVALAIAEAFKDLAVRYEKQLAAEIAKFDQATR